MPGISIVGIDTTTSWGLVVLFFVALLTGMVIPRWMHKQRIADYKDHNKLLQEMVVKRDEQFDKALENNALVVKALEGIRRQTEATKS